MTHPAASTTLYAGVPLQISAPIDASQNLEPTDMVRTSSVFGSVNFDPTAMTPQSLMVYLQSRLGGIDKQMTDVFERQNKGERVRGELHQIQELFTNLKSEEKTDKVIEMPDVDAFRSELATHLENIRDIDPQLADDLQAKLTGEGQIMFKVDLAYTTNELENSKELLNIVGKDLDSSSQMDMISLQQMMSTRQTAIQLATNLIAALGETSKSVVSNIR